jgi:hypothetical protein
LQRKYDYTDSRIIKTHMEKHRLLAHEQAEELGWGDFDFEEAIQDLVYASQMAPAEVRPLYAVAIANLRGLKDTKPSQDNLIKALKTIQEMTGMRQEQRLMLEFGRALFGERRIEAVEVKELTGGGE